MYTHAQVVFRRYIDQCGRCSTTCKLGWFDIHYFGSQQSVADASFCKVAVLLHHHSSCRGVIACGLRWKLLLLRISVPLCLFFNSLRLYECTEWLQRVLADLFLYFNISLALGKAQEQSQIKLACGTLCNRLFKLAFTKWLQYLEIAAGREDIAMLLFTNFECAEVFGSIPLEQKGLDLQYTWFSQKSVGMFANSIPLLVGTSAVKFGCFISERVVPLWRPAQRYVFLLSSYHTSIFSTLSSVLYPTVQF